MQGCSVGCTIGVSDVSACRVLQPRNVPSGVSRTEKKTFSSGYAGLWVRRDFVFLCRTTVRTCPFVSHAVSLDVQQYSRVQQKSLSINNPRSQHVCTIKVHTAVLQLNKKRKRRDGEIQLTLCPEWSALLLSQNRKCSDYLPSPGEQL